MPAVAPNKAKEYKLALLHRLQELKALGDMVFIDELIDLFATESAVRLKNLGGLLKRENFSEAAKIFHQLQGSAANLGARKLHDLCAAGEEACTKKVEADAQKYRSAVAREVTVLKNILPNWESLLS